MIYTDAIGTWTTPAGNPANYTFRQHTNDWNTLSSIHTNNEYALPVGLTGWALDIGGHLGGVSIALALDNPGLRVLCVEPLPDNTRLIRQNLAHNGLSERVTVLEAAAGNDPLIRYGGEGNEHGFVGNSNLIPRVHDELRARCYSLTALLRKVKAERIAFLKIDCEGCEWSFLADPSIGKVERIAGEWHPPGTPDELRRLFDPTHELRLIGEHGFSAVLR